MHIFVYSDESGVFDKKHEDYFVYGGLIFLSKAERDNASRKYYSLESELKQRCNFKTAQEFKGSKINKKSKYKLFKSLNPYHKFAAIIELKSVKDAMFSDKKTKQRYMDFAYKLALKKALSNLIETGCIDANKVEFVHVICDEHTTATNGLYELRETLEMELKRGVLNYEKMAFYNPLFKNLKSLDVVYAHSDRKPLIRAADIIANTVYYKSKNSIPINNNNFSIRYFHYDKK